MFCALLATAQAPQKFNYQAVARNAQGAVLPNQNVKIRASILHGSANGTNQYSETHSATTSQLGLFNLAIGSGTLVNGNFTNITWASGDKYLKIERDATGGNNFTLVGTSQLLSVPYALNAKKVEIESQTLSVNGNQLAISQGNSITLPSSGGGSNTSIQEMPLLSGSSGGSSISTNFSVMTYSIGGNEIYISQTNAAGNGFSELSVLEFKKDNSSGVYYKNRIISAGQVGGIGGMTIFNGDLYINCVTPFPQNTYLIRKLNLTSSQI